MSCLAQCTNLHELSLDGNPVANNTDHRQSIIYHVYNLKTLDQSPVLVGVANSLKTAGNYIICVALPPCPLPFSFLPPFVCVGGRKRRDNGYSETRRGETKGREKNDCLTSNYITHTHTHTLPLLYRSIGILLL